MWDPICFDLPEWKCSLVTCEKFCHMWKVLKSFVTCEKFSKRSHFARDSHPHHCIVPPSEDSHFHISLTDRSLSLSLLCIHKACEDPQIFTFQIFTFLDLCQAWVGKTRCRCLDWKRNWTSLFEMQPSDPNPAQVAPSFNFFCCQNWGEKTGKLIWHFYVEGEKLCGKIESYETLSHHFAHNCGKWKPWEKFP